MLESCTVYFINTLRLLEIPKELLDWPRAKGGNDWITLVSENACGPPASPKVLLNVAGVCEIR